MNRKKPETIDADATKEHVLRAGKELLLAARGALKFCQTYVETSNKERNDPKIADFFNKALAVAEELSRGLEPEKKGPKKRKNSDSWHGLRDTSPMNYVPRTTYHVSLW